MNKNESKIVIRIVADILYAFGFLLLVPALLGLFMAEYMLAVTFTLMTGVLIPGCLWLRKHTNAAQAQMRHAAMALALSWMLLSLLSSIPFIVHRIPWIDATFEAFSAWTDTGFTMIPHPEDLPLSLSAFRVISQWASGIGIVILMLSFRGPSAQVARSLFEAEGRLEAFNTNIWQVGRTIAKIYLGYTLVGFLLLMILGVPPLEALAHAITSLSTGGFSTNSVGVGLYGLGPTIVALILMLCGGISFESHQALLSGKIKRFFQNPEIRILFIIILVASALILFEQALVRGEWIDRIEASVFYVISTITTCGAGTTLPLSEMPDTALFTLSALTITGAVYGSTTGGLKLWRILIIAKLIGRELARPFYPTGTVMPIRIGRTVISDETALQVTSYTLLYLTIAVAGSIVLMLFGQRTIHALFTVLSAQGNVGLNAIPDAAYYGMHPALKLQLVFHMLIGRMEILPLFYLLRTVRVPLRLGRKL